MSWKALAWLVAGFLICTLLIPSIPSSPSSEEAILSTKGLVEDKFVRVNVEGVKLDISERREVLAESIKLGPPSPIAPKATTNNYSTPSMLVAPNGWIHMVFENRSSPDVDIVYARSTDGGATWAYGDAPRSGDQRNPGIVRTSDGTLTIVSEDPTQFTILQSTNEGDSWTTYGYSGTEWWADAKYPALAANGTWIYAAVEWWDSTAAAWKIKFRYSSDSGAGWGTVLIDVADSRHPSVALNSVNAIITFQLGAPTSSKLYVWHAALGSSSGVADALTGNYRHSSVTASGVYAYVAWTRDWTATDDDISVAWSTNSGNNWAGSRVFGSTENERYPAIMAYGQGAHVGFANDTTKDTWYAYSSNPASVGFGGSLISTVLNVANSTYRFCDIIVNNTGDPNVVWTDTRDGGLDIYFCRYKGENIRITGPPTAPPPPTHTFNFLKGWNFISLPLSNETLNNASQLAEAVGENCTYIANWTGSDFQTYVSATGANNFDLELGRGYNVYVSADTTFTMGGSEIASKTLTLTKGWNSIGVLGSTITNASTLATQNENCTAVGYWNNILQRFVVHPRDTGVSNFAVGKGNGYLVYVTAATTWVLS